MFFLLFIWYQSFPLRSITFGCHMCSHLEVPVNNSIWMTVVDGFQDLLNTVRGISFGVELPGYNVFKQFPTSHSATQIDKDGAVKSLNIFNIMFILHIIWFWICLILTKYSIEPNGSLGFPFSYMNETGKVFLTLTEVLGLEILLYST